MKEPTDIQSAFFDLENESSTLTAALKALESQPENQSLSRAFLIFSTLELLAQFRYGSLDQKGSVKRLKKFVLRYSNWNATECEWLIQFRNAVIHTQGQWAYDMRSKKEYRFTWESAERTIEKHTNSVINIDINRFEAQLKRMMRSYREELEDSKHLSENFHTVYRKLGKVFQR